MSDDPANDAAPTSSSVSLGENPVDLVFGCGVDGDRVVIKFNTLVQWFDIPPDMAIKFAEKIIDCAMQAAHTPEAVRSRIIKPGNRRSRRAKGQMH